MAAAALLLPAAMAIMILLLNPTGGDAVTSFKPLFNNDTLSAGKYLVGNQDIELEFLMESHISRILAGSQKSQTSATNDPNKASSADCDRPPRYDSCLGNKGSNPPANCGTYNRANPC